MAGPDYVPINLDLMLASIEAIRRPSENFNSERKAEDMLLGYSMNARNQRRSAFNYQPTSISKPYGCSTL
jgi:hypothetical protein